jgi:hypothetical protein
MARRIPPYGRRPSVVTTFGVLAELGIICICPDHATKPDSPEARPCARHHEGHTGQPHCPNSTSDSPPAPAAGFSSARAVIRVTRASLARRLSLLWSSGRYLSGSASRPVSPCETSPVELDGAFSPKPPSSPLRKRAPPMRRGSTTQNKVRGLVCLRGRPDINRKSADKRQPPQRRFDARHNEKAPLRVRWRG